MSTPGTGPQPGELARLTAVYLTAAGLTATIPDPTAPDDPSRLAIDCRAARCALAVSDTADAELHWTPHAGDGAADPHRVAGLAAALLSGPPPAPHPHARRRDTTFKAIVGAQLRAAGFAVSLNVYPDDHQLDVTTEIAVTNPAANGGTVYASDDGGLTWHRDYWDDHAATRRKPHYTEWLPHPADVARAIAADVARALTTSQGHPAAPAPAAAQAAP